MVGDNIMQSYNGFTPEERLRGEQILKEAIRNGILPPLNQTRCAICGQDKGIRHYHNEDYSPENIIADATPLCWRCHMHIHAKNKTTPKWQKYEREVFQGNKRWKPVYNKWWKDADKKDIKMVKMKTKHPVDNIEWIPVEKLDANDYNPNHVFKNELNLIKFSIMKNGWIQPILITKDYKIIDGFHRSTIAKLDKDVNNLTNGKVPCVVMDMSEPERILLTIRINRAKGSHSAYKMHKVVSELVEKYHVPIKTICTELGMDKSEVDLLLEKNVFSKLKIDENTKFNQAWIPRKKMG